MKTRLGRVVGAGLIAAQVVGCATAPSSGQVGPRPTGSAAPAPSESDAGATTTKGVGCVLGAVAAGLVAKALAAADAKRQKLSPAAAAKRERSYILGFAVLGCGGGAMLAGTAYAKLSDAGKQAREKELQQAASSARPRAYADPANPSLRGRVVPGPAYAEGGNRECRDIEDTLSDGGQGEPAVIKMCRTPPNGGWAAATA